MDLELQGKAAVVTGGSFGLGRAVATRLASEGASVAIVARGREDLERAAAEIANQTGGSVIAVPADVRDQAQVDAMVSQVIAALGGIDILINNAGTSSAGPFAALDDATLQEDLDLKLFGAVHCTRAALPALLERRGAVVNITTPQGKAPPAGSIPTSVSRAAGIALTKALANEYAASGVRVNTVCVNGFMSRQIRRRWEAANAKDPQYTLEQFSDEAGRAVALGRLGEPEEIADVVVFLASPRASFVTGTAINADGGSSPVV